MAKKVAKKKEEKRETERREALLFDESDKRIVKLSLEEKGEDEIVLEWSPIQREEESDEEE